MWICTAHCHEAPLMRYHFSSRTSVLISASQPSSQASVNTVTPWIRASVSCDMPVFPQLSPGTHSSLTTEDWLRLSRPGCLVLCPNGGVVHGILSDHLAIYRLDRFSRSRNIGIRTVTSPRFFASPSSSNIPLIDVLLEPQLGLKHKLCLADTRVELRSSISTEQSEHVKLGACRRV